ncbi:MAG: NERD domain-containing protein [Clostridiales bacterium]|nr:NERD domain-containing protein [Clostridiales bacterium]
MDNEAGKAAKGKRGEELVLTELKSIFGEDALFFRNVLIPQKSNSGKSFECDIICVSRKGIFVFEVKNWEGHIEANMLSQKWGFKKRYESNYSQFDNPVMQNEMHRTALCGLLGEPVTSIVVLNNINNYFTINRYATDSVNVPVLLTTELKDFFYKNYREDKYSNQQLYALYSKISDMEKESERLKSENAITAAGKSGVYQQQDIVPTTKTNDRKRNYRRNNNSRKKKRTGIRIVRLAVIIFLLFVAGVLLNEALKKSPSSSGGNKTTVAQNSATTKVENNSAVTTADKNSAATTAEPEPEIPDAVKNRRVYSIDELSAMPVVQTVERQVVDMRLGESLLYRYFKESYVENYEQKTVTAQAYITPVEYITGDDALVYYDYLSKEFKYNRPLRAADNEQYAVVRLYWWYLNEELPAVDFDKTSFAETSVNKNAAIRFYVDGSEYYWSNETGNRENITGLYIEDIDDSAIIDGKVASGTPVELIYLIPVSRDLDYTLILNLQNRFYLTEQARLVLE